MLERSRNSRPFFCSGFLYYNVLSSVYYKLFVIHSIIVLHLCMTNKKNTAVSIKVIEAASRWESKDFLKTVRLHKNDIAQLEQLMDTKKINGKEVSSGIRACIQFTYKSLIG